MIEVIQKEIHNPLDNFLYLVKYKEHDHDSFDTFISIDPYDGPLVLHEMQKNSSHFKLKMIINTHSHYDHTRGNDYLTNEFPDVLVINYQNYNSMRNLSSFIEFFPMIGHTLDHIGVIFYENHEMKYFFSGDTLFYAGIGNTKNGGRVQHLYDTIGELDKKIHDKTIVYPGHNYLLKNLQFAFRYADNLKEKEDARILIDLVNSGDTLYPFSMKEIKTINLFLKHCSNKKKFIELRSARDRF